MAEDLNQEPTAEEKAKFEQDVMKAAEEAMKMEAEANKAEAEKAEDSEERHCEEQGDEAIQKEPSAETALLGDFGVPLQHFNELVGIGGVVLVDASHVKAAQAERVQHGLTVCRGVDAVFASIP